MTSKQEPALEAFRCDLVDRLRSVEPLNVMSLPGGTLLLPRVFGFCRGVKRALAMAQQAVVDHEGQAGQLILLGEIIHNPYVNAFFEQRGVEIVTREHWADLDARVQPDDFVIIPAFGVPLPVLDCLQKIGCPSIDCSCGDVIRLWRWSEQAVSDGYAVLIYGRSKHDETMVTKSRLAEAGGSYLVVQTLDDVDRFCRLLRENRSEEFAESFSADQTNASSLAPFEKLAQVSQTTMLYDDTMAVRERLKAAFEDRFGGGQEDERLRFQPTVCQATQDRQNAAVELCRSGCDLVVVVGGFGSSNTRHLFELASQYAPAYLIEDAQAIISEQCLRAWDRQADAPQDVHDWLPAQRPLRIGVLAGASSPEVVIGQVLQRLAQFLQ